ncbi:PEGA domain-containing protein [Corallococcus sp. Z5C101001]|uniref:PEGA domain-containing protein n=1 Tax=Corallococcus sp. Z5C101001 TaxID=2596829 RepID=UPI00117D8B5D|nr:PEGA domain-containing protein [Corallococcus sp. Z5C101001]TSC31151.1 PEGA domain-containing protein [Corallococcus sp. Z5C101001]
MRVGWAAVLTLAVLVGGCAAKQEQPATVVRARELMASAEGKSGDLVLRCEPSDADVLLDGVEQGKCSDFSGVSRSLRLHDAGFHQVEVKKRGFYPYTTYYSPSGARVTLNVKLRPLAPEGGGAP